MLYSKNYTILNFILWSCIIANNASAEVTVYKSIDKNGQVIYTDKANAEAQRINVTPQNTIKVSTSKNIIKQPPPSVSNPITITIKSFEDHETIRDNQGNISINAETSSSIPFDHSFQLFIDGNLHSPQQTTPNFSIANLERGMHKIKIVLVDDTGKVIALSPIYTIYMHRASIN